MEFQEQTVRGVDIVQIQVRPVLHEIIVFANMIGHLPVSTQLVSVVAEHPDEPAVRPSRRSTHQVVEDAVTSKAIQTSLDENRHVIVLALYIHIRPPPLHALSCKSNAIIS